jgi:hypothetical protein
MGRLVVHLEINVLPEKEETLFFVAALLDHMKQIVRQIKYIIVGKALALNLNSTKANS